MKTDREGSLTRAACDKVNRICVGVAPSVEVQGRCDGAGSERIGERPLGERSLRGFWFWVGGFGLSRILLVELRSGGLGQTKRDDRRAVFARRSLLGITQGDKVSLQL